MLKFRKSSCKLTIASNTDEEIYWRNSLSYRPTCRPTFLRTHCAVGCVLHEHDYAERRRYYTKFRFCFNIEPLIFTHDLKAVRWWLQGDYRVVISTAVDHDSLPKHNVVRLVVRRGVFNEPSIRLQCIRQKIPRRRVMRAWLPGYLADLWQCVSQSVWVIERSVCARV